MIGKLLRIFLIHVSKFNQHETLKKHITLLDAFQPQEANCGPGGVSQTRFATSKRAGSGKTPTQVLCKCERSLPQPQRVFTLLCLGERGDTQAFPSASGKQCRQIQSLGTICHKALPLSQPKPAHRKELQFFTFLTSGKCIICKEKVMLG